jgi:hypothetical protein
MTFARCVSTALTATKKNLPLTWGSIRRIIGQLKALGYTPDLRIFASFYAVLEACSLHCTAFGWRQAGFS